MLLYSKLYDLLTSRKTLKCSIKELYGVMDDDGKSRLTYIYFITENNTPCLLTLPAKYDIKMDNKKFLLLEKWEEKHEMGFGAIIAADIDKTIVKEIKADCSPQKLITFLSKLKSSLISISYSAAILSEEHLCILNTEDDIDVYFAKGTKETKLLVVLDLETLLFKNIIPELERVYKNINKLIQEGNREYWDSLLKLLTKCQQLKIVSTGSKQDNPAIEQSMKICLAHKAIMLALECFEE
jgi:hypothetical protein